MQQLPPLLALLTDLPSPSIPLFLPSPPFPPASFPPPPSPPISLSSPPPSPPISPFDPLASSFRPSIAVIIGVLTTMFSLTFLLLLYAKHCKRHGIGVYDRTDLSLGAASPAPPPPLIHGRNSGVDRAIIDILPTFSFASLHGLKEGLECAVCLSRFDTPDILRLLPKCRHAFHLECVDTWLNSHSTCPLCRNRVEAEDVFLVEDFAAGVKCNINEPARLSGARRPSSAGRNSNAEATAGIQVYVQRDTDNSRVQSSDDSKNNPSRLVSLWKSSSRKLRPGKTPFDQHEFTKRFGHRIIIADALSQRRWSDFLPSDALFLSSHPHIGGQGALERISFGSKLTSSAFAYSPSANSVKNTQALEDNESDANALQQSPRLSAADMSSQYPSSSRTQDTFLSRLSASRKEAAPAAALPSSTDLDVPGRLSSSKIQDMFKSRLSASRKAGAGLLNSSDRDVEAAEEDAKCGKQARGEEKQGIFERQTSFLRRAFAVGRENSSSSSMQLPSYRRSVSEVSGIKRYEEAGKNGAMSSDEEARQWFSIARRTVTWIMGGGKDRPFSHGSGHPGQ
ncbi:hypothetical protein L7F22_035177 [Adiantum nelumboides]|nr:hypothetical protein [Adiantum nelumboides]